ncbi:MAG: hypothetical protein A2942_00380 [Candidatus Lloydbacteria bacterium RIFCSPLOWO2_01_FULL_50_20]|uniref:Uncharacterized protein n=1 Tax=Candidatus Lloydbacteria bacterium RIFCSPLOWO2_01_FULL_50_20 TaxID=1798665 RepID=A0A1G2DEF0_9BACT|nr:MAG: hypothetical protein A3C13_02260 [Candidatus Lloydbacteria bacterium RIFCSPHIGHO2_02_FULL_50_11]OGZ11240.1 MAG: hypothetical protein A2942_00380 [Candidatus Lloydbacteria bacterium RIFCSPLOWO2_01_FULL_50_20]
MEKILGKISFSFLGPLVRRFTSGQMNDNMLWRSVIGCTIFAAIIIGFLAWLSFGEVTTEPTVSPLIRKNKAVLSIEELRGVIDFYRKKEEEFTALHSISPRAPQLHKGSGVSIPLNSVETSEEELPL